MKMGPRNSKLKITKEIQGGYDYILLSLNMEYRFMFMLKFGE